MDHNALLTSLCITITLIILCLKIKSQIPESSSSFYGLTSVLDIQTTVEYKDIKSFVNSHEFSLFNISTRSSIVTNYLIHSSRPVYDCLLQRGGGCYAIKKGESVYASKVYSEQDMTMRYPHPYGLRINNPNACSPETWVVIGTPVGPRQFVDRMATRNTWGRIRHAGQKNVIHLFFAGQDANDEEGDRLLEEENNYYHDIIQFDSRNHFMNLTLLAILTYNWTSTYCPHIAYYVRADNDMWYDPRYHIVNYLDSLRNSTMIGRIVRSNKPIRVPQSRYYLSKRVFNRTSFDPYPSGCFVTIAYDTLSMIVKYSEMVGPIIYFDDVFLGQIARKANISLLDYPNKDMYFWAQKYEPIMYSSLVAAHKYAPQDILALWSLGDR